jgi:hypothetical protein
VIIPEEEILRGQKPTTEEIDDHRQCLLGQLGTPIGSRYLVQREFDADLPEAFLDQHANRLVGDGDAEIERQCCLEPVRQSGLG